MPDRSMHEQELDRFFNDLAIGRPGVDYQLDPSLMETVRTLRTMAAMPPPAPAREHVAPALQAEMARLAEHHAGGTRPSPGEISPNFSHFGHNGRASNEPGMATTAAHSLRRPRWLSPTLAAAAILVLALVGGVVAARFIAAERTAMVIEAPEPPSSRNSRRCQRRKSGRRLDIIVGRAMDIPAWFREADDRAARRSPMGRGRDLRACGHGRRRPARSRTRRRHASRRWPRAGAPERQRHHGRGAARSGHDRFLTRGVRPRQHFAADRARYRGARSVAAGLITHRLRADDAARRNHAPHRARHRPGLGRRRGRATRLDPGRRQPARKLAVGPGARVRRGRQVARACPWDSRHAAECRGRSPCPVAAARDAADWPTS